MADAWKGIRKLEVEEVVLEVQKQNSPPGLNCLFFEPLDYYEARNGVVLEERTDYWKVDAEACCK